MKILMLLSNPFITDPRVYKEAKALADAGNKVTVIVWDRRHEYKSEDTIDDIRLIRLHNTSLMKILPNDLFRNPIWWRKAYKKGLKLYKENFNFDVVHCHDFDTLRVSVKLKKKTGCKLVYDAHEIFAHMILETMPKIFVKLTFWSEKRLIKHVNRIITVNDPVKKYLQSISNKPINIVMNCKSLISKKYQPPPKNSIFTVCYIGGFVKSRLFPDIIDIIGRIENVKFVVAGTKSGLYEEVKNRCKKYDNVEFLGQIPSKEVIPRTLECNIIICMFDPDRIGHQIGLPNKIFEAMVAGRPIIVTKNMYYSDEFVEKERFGLSIKNNSENIHNGIVKLRDNPKLCEELGRNALNAALKRYNWDKEKEKLLKVYEELK